MARPRRPTRRTMLLAVGGAISVAVAAFLVVYFVLFPTSSPKPFKLSATPAGSTNASPSSAAPKASPSSVAGTWKVASGSMAGYRVREKLGFLPAQSDAVGRTSQMTGSASFTQSSGKVTIRTASFTVAVDTLKSDRSMRDEKIHDIGLESSRYPTATFTLATPATIPTSAITGKVARVTATGTFNIHGVAKTVTVPVEMSLSGSTFEAAGSLTFPWSEFGMTAPSVGGFVNVTDKATMEFALRMQRA